MTRGGKRPLPAEIRPWGDISDSGHESDTEKKTVKRRGRKRRASSESFQYLAEKTAK